MESTMTIKNSVTTSVTTRKLITYGAFFAFFLFGFVDNLKGPTLPALLENLQFSYAQGGTIVFGAYIGFLIATLLTGPLADIAGNKAVILICCTCWMIGIGGYSYFSLFGLLAVMMFVLGFGLGAVEVGANLVIVDLYHEQKGKYLNLLAFFHGAGSMLAPLYAGKLLATGISWRQVYQYSLLLVIALFIYFIVLKYPHCSSGERSSFDMKALGKSAFTPEMILYYLAIALYVGAEIGIGSWLVDFLQKAKSQSVMRSSFYLSLFFAAITAGRFVGSFLVERVGYVKIMLYASLASAACIGLGIFGPASLALFLPATGLFFSVLFPTIVAAVSDLHKENVGTIFGLLFAFAGLGGAFGPWMIGIGNDWLGLRAGFGMILVFCVVMSLAFFLLLKRTNGQER
jgi:fucose permease